MRVLLDTNVYISYLLAPTIGRHPYTIVDVAILGHIIPLVSRQLLDELVRRVTTKPYLSRRIDREDLFDLVEVLRLVGEGFDTLPEQLPEVGHDRRDDFIFAHAVVEQPFCIVSGDKGVQKIREIDGIPIYSPAAFVQMLQIRGIIQPDQNTE